MSQFAWTFPGGKLHQEVTSVVVVNNTELVIDVAVPTGKIWLLKSIKMYNPDDVNRDLTIQIYKEAAKTNMVNMILNIVSTTAGDFHQFPTDYVDTSVTQRLNLLNQNILVAGNVLNLIWAAGGASTGATDADGLVIVYLEIDAP